MKFTEEKITAINGRLADKKRENPFSFRQIGIGVNLDNSSSGATIFKDIMGFCNVEELSRMIEELQMLKEAIEEETGLIL